MFSEQPRNGGALGEVLGGCSLSRLNAGAVEQAAGRVGSWWGRLTGRGRNVPIGVRLYQLGATHSAIVAAPAGLIDGDRGLSGLGLTPVLVVEPSGAARAAGEPPCPGDGFLFQASVAELAARIRGHRPPLGEPLLFDLRDDSGIVAAIRVRIAPGSSVAGRTLTDLRFRQRFWAVVTALWHDGRPIERDWGEHTLAPGDEFVALGRRKRVEELTRLADFEVVTLGRPEDPGIDQQTLVLSVPANSPLVGASLRSGSLGGLVELSIIGIRRRGEPRLAISQEDPIRVGDPLLAVGEPLQVLSLLQRGVIAAEAEVPAAGS